jgi:hypothetical protein
MPNPEFEGIARQVKASVGKAGGEALIMAIYETEVAAGSAMLTRIHHRQTPLFLMQDAVGVGVTWQSQHVPDSISFALRKRWRYSSQSVPRPSASPSPSEPARC